MTRKELIIRMSFAALAASAGGAETAASAAPPNPTIYNGLAGAIEENFKTHILSKWYPDAVDPSGGFFQNFDEKWTRTSDPVRSVVYQSRLTWTAAQIALRYPARKAEFAGYARHGLAFLKQTQWDAARGGLYWAVDSATGKPTTALADDKHAYGISFAIYAAVAAHEATGDTDALAFAKQAFGWLDAHAHDAKNKGYHEALSGDGKPVWSPPPGRDATSKDVIGTVYGLKSMNTHIHLLEAFAALHEASPGDADVAARLREVFLLVRDRVADPTGYLNLYFTPDWKPVPDHDSFGHDIETTFLLAEAATALGMPGDAATEIVARRLTDHALQYGWDAKNGGFWDAGHPSGKPIVREKIWWTQAEGLNALLLLHERYQKETPRYWDAFLKQWAFIRDHQTDAVNGGWRGSVHENGAPVAKQTKSDAWTDPYHQGRALLNVSARLRRLATS